jgi:hypothetical protein
MKLKRIVLALSLGIGLITASIAGPYDDWPDDAVCMWLDMKPTHEGYLAEVKKRSITCQGGKAVAGASPAKTLTSTKTSSTTSSTALAKNSDIIIYEVVFAPVVLNELLERTLSKTDYDFSKHKLTKNLKDFTCYFTLRRKVFDQSSVGIVENWNMAQGNLNIRGSDVEFANGSFWKMGGISSDKSYLRDEVNLKITEDGYLVGKMAYFTHSVKQGEAPMSPRYVTLKKNKKSVPISFQVIKTRAKFFIDVEDWAGGLLTLNNCREGSTGSSGTTKVNIITSSDRLASIELSNDFDGSYKFTLTGAHPDGVPMGLGHGILEINKGIVTINKDSKGLLAKKFDSFKGRIDRNGDIVATFHFCPLRSGCENKTVLFDGNINMKKLTGFYDYMPVNLYLINKIESFSY